MKVNLQIVVPLISAICLGGCSGYLLPDIQAFEADILTNYPIGSEVSQLETETERLGFQWTENEPFSSATSGQISGKQCLTRQISYGFWAGGTRLICIAQNEGRIQEIDVFELVAGL